MPGTGRSVGPARPGNRRYEQEMNNRVAYEKRRLAIRGMCHGCVFNAIDPWMHRPDCEEWQNKVGDISGW